MSDPNDQRSTPIEAAPELSEQLARSLNSIWERHASARPGSSNVELSGDVVRFKLTGAVGLPDPEPNADGADADADDGPARSPDSASYRNEATAAVAKITHRRVRGFIPSRNGDTHEASDTYILEPRAVRR